VRPAALALVLVAALLHSVWNALAKRGGDPLAFLWSSVTLASVALVPAAMMAGGFAPAVGAAAPFVAATIAVHALYFYALSRAYGAGDFSRVYPIARGLGVGLVPLGAGLLLGERLLPAGILGIGLVVTGIVAVGVAGSGGPAGGARRGAGTAWAVLTGVSIATYSLVDTAGVGRMHPVPYLVLMGLGISGLLAPVVWRRRQRLAAEWRGGWRAILVASSLNLTSYLLVLFAFRLSPAGYVVAARELSIPISVVIGRLLLAEPAVGLRLAGAVVILGGVSLIAVAGR
jgi:drug/metabolite transporter (DMT)-like permease